MADEPKRISELDPATAGLETDIYPVVQAAGTRKQTRAQLRTAIFSSLQAFMRTFLSAASPAAAREQIQAAGSGVNADITRITGLTTPLTVGQGGTGQDTVAEFAADIAAVKLGWSNFTPVVTALTTPPFTAASATCTYSLIGGICHGEMALTVTTKGTGSLPQLTLPVPAHASWIGRVMLCRMGTGARKMGVAVIQDANTVFITGYDNSELVTGDGITIYVTLNYRIA